MYAGQGSESMLEAAAAWNGLAAELHAMAANYASAISDLDAGWQGPSSVRMTAAATSYRTWITTTASQAEQTASQAQAAAAAYENAFLATVPPEVVAANRSLLVSLIATNIFGQNTGAIAATEAHYAEMWAQDASAMYGYVGSSAAAAQLTPFQPAPQTTSPTGGVSQAAAVGHAMGSAAGAQATAALPQTLQSLAPIAATAVGAPADPPLFTPAEIFVTLLTSFLNATIGPLSPVKLYGPFGSFYDLALQTFLAPFNNFNMQMAYGAALGKAATAAGAVAPQLGSAAPAVTAAIGNAELVGSLSVPPSWTGAAPALSSFTTAMSQPGLAAAVPAAVAADSQGSVFSNMALSALAGRAVAGSARGAGSTVGGGAGMIAAETATVTIIVIPED